MGTNYYAVRNGCEHCHRGDDQLHIGKSSAGWSFSFQAYCQVETWDEKPIDSWERWQEVLQSDDVVIRDEYEEIVTFDELAALVAGKIDEKLNHTTYMRVHHPQSAEGCTLDGDGYSFSTGDFS